MDKIELISYEIKFLPPLDGGCIGKSVSKYVLKGGLETKEDEIKEGK